MSRPPRGPTDPVVCVLTKRGRLVVAEPLFDSGERISLPGRTKFSIPIISHEGSRSRNQFARELPTKPQIPVMRSLIAGNDDVLQLLTRQNYF